MIPQSLKSIMLYLLSYSIWAAIVEYYRLVVINHINLFFTALKARKSKIKEPVDSVSSEDPLPGS